MSTNKGFVVYSLAHPTKVIKLYHNKTLGEVSLISMQFRTNIVAVVTRTQKIQNNDLVSYGGSMMSS